MGDGPPGNIPPGLDAVAGYVDASGIGVTYPQIVTEFPSSRHLSIAVHGAPAECADVENGAMTSWAGYTVGYCSVSRANSLIATFGRPRKLWTAHYTGVSHLCGPACGLTGTTADATQWTDHGGVWDESACANNFFDFQNPPLPERELIAMELGNDPQGHLIIVGVAADNGNLLQFVEDPPGTWRCIDVTYAVKATQAPDPRLYQVKA